MATAYVVNNATAFALGLNPNSGAFELDQAKLRLKRMKHGVMRWAHCAREFVDSSGRCDILFVTLTLRPGVEYSPRLISGFIKAMRDRRYPILGYAWTLELQKRGAPHWHLAVLVPRGFRIPFPDRPSGRKGVPLWPYGSSNVQLARKSWGVLTYLAKYLSKGPSSAGVCSLPEGARIYATVLSVKTWRRIGRKTLNIWRDRVLPGWVRMLQGYDHPVQYRASRNSWGQWFIWDNLAGEGLTGGFYLWESPYQVDA